MTLLRFMHFTANQILREIKFGWMQTQIFTWNWILANLNCTKCHFWQFQRLQTLNFGKSATWELLKFTKNQNLEPIKLLKMSFLDCLKSTVSLKYVSCTITIFSFQVFEKFYVKSHFGEFKQQSKNDIFSNFLVNWSNFQVPDLPKFKVQRL